VNVSGTGRTKVAAAIRCRIWQRRPLVAAGISAGSVSDATPAALPRRASLVCERASPWLSPRRTATRLQVLLVKLVRPSLGFGAQLGRSHSPTGTMDLGTCGGSPRLLSLWLCPRSSPSLHPIIPSSHFPSHQRDGALVRLERLDVFDESQSPAGFKKGVAAPYTENY
jgi:hypothetical protein